MRKNNPKIDNFMNRNDSPELTPVVLVLMTLLVTFWFMAAGKFLVKRQDNLMKPINCVASMNESLKHERRVVSKKCDELRERGIIEYDVDSDIWLLTKGENK